ncbi:MAG TPA: hypothetical protein VIJ38_08625 [Acidobacteriaceae bacterium]
MSRMQQTVLDRVSERPASAALRQIREMALNENVEVEQRTIVQPAHEVLSVWSIRLWNATLRARRFVGLVDLVRTLLKLSPEEEVEQIALRSGSKVGLVFFAVKTRQPIGAVISAKTDSDVRRSERNWEEAKGMQFPVLFTKSSVR